MIAEHEKLFLSLFENISQIKCLSCRISPYSAIPNGYCFQLKDTKYYLTISREQSMIRIMWFDKQPLNWFKHLLFEEVFNNASEAAQLELSFYFDLFTQGEEIKFKD